MAGKVENKKLEEYENENYYLLWWSDKRHFPYNCLGLSDEDNSVSQTDNFVNVNVFSSITSPHVLSYCCVLHYFSTMPVGFNFNLTFGLKPQVSGIKIVTVYKQSIFQVERLIATLILVALPLSVW